MQDVEVIEDPTVAAVSLDPLRARLLRELVTPSSAAMLAAAVGLPRQKVNYHLRSLEEHGLVLLVEERRKGNVMERLLQATAAAYVISPSALAGLAPDPARFHDRFSAYWLLALAARLVREVGSLLRGSVAAGRPLATFAIDGEVTFATAAARAAFAEELGAAVAELVEKHHDGGAPRGRKHRIVIALHPSLKAGAIGQEPDQKKSTSNQKTSDQKEVAP